MGRGEGVSHLRESPSREVSGAWEREEGATLMGGNGFSHVGMAVTCGGYKCATMTGCAFIYIHSWHK